MHQNETGIFPVAILDFIGLGILGLVLFIKNNFEIFCVISTILIFSILLFYILYKINKKADEDREEALFLQKERELELERIEREKRAKEAEQRESERKELYLKRVKYVKETSPKLYDLTELISNTENLPIISEVKSVGEDFSVNFSVKYKFDNFRFDNYMIEEVGKEIPYFAELAKRMEEGLSILQDNLMYYDTIVEKEYDLIEIINASNGLITEEVYRRIENKIINEKVIEDPRIRVTHENLEKYGKSKYAINISLNNLYIRVNKSFRSPGGRSSLSDLYYVDASALKDYIRRAVQLQEYNNTEEARRKKERSALTLRLRYKVLQRDDFKCTICGRGYEDGVSLHVDHIIPVSKGGRTEIDNLRTLCSDCNWGKSDLIENEEDYKEYMEGREEE